MYKIPLTTQFTVEYGDPDEQLNPYWVYRAADYFITCTPCARGFDVELYDKAGTLIGSECTKLTEKQLQLSTSIKLWELKRRLYTKLLWEWDKKGKDDRRTNYTKMDL